MAAAVKSDLWVRIASALVLFVIAGAALWFGGIAFGLLLLVGGALVLVEWFALVRSCLNPSPSGEGGETWQLAA
jgi:phosphatidate cytidylyltransferase